MDMHRSQAKLFVSERMQQDDGIDAAGEPDQKAFAAEVFDRAPDGGGDVSAPGLP